MAWELTSYSLVGVVAATISAAVTVDTWRHRGQRLAVPLMVLMITLTAWSIVYAVQLGFGALGPQLAWQRLTLGIAGLVPTAWLVFTLSYAGHREWLTRRRLALLAVDPAGFFLLTLTNPMHGLVWTRATLVRTGGGAVPDLALGPGYTVHIVYAYAAVAAGILLLLTVAARSSSMYRRQVGLLVAGATPALLSHVAFTLGVGPIPTLDKTPFVFAVTGILFGLALFRFDLLERTPVARFRAFEETGDGMVVVDPDGAVVDTDGIARRAFDPSPAPGDTLTELFPDRDLASLDGTYHTATVDGSRRTYHIQVSPLRDHHDQVTGHLVLLRDVTTLHAYEQRLRVSNRVLRHNLRNDMNVISGFAENLAASLDGQPAEDARIISARAERLTEMTEKARRLTRMNGDGSTYVVDVVGSAERIVSEFRETYPDAEFGYDAPDELLARVADPDRFAGALRNVVENAVEHSDSTVPRTDVSVREVGGMARIRVSDNGPGIPEMEQLVFEGGVETPLRHSQGLGLWVAYWCAVESGGDISLDSTPEGTTVTLEFPTGDPADA